MINLNADITFYRLYFSTDGAKAQFGGTSSPTNKIFASADNLFESNRDAKNNKFNFIKYYAEVYRKL